jgi:hypothetical protein
MAQKKPKTTDDLSFGEAFKIFRKKHGGDGGRFRWKGNVYTTDLTKPKAKSKSSAPATSKRPQARTPATTSSGPSKRPVVTGAKPPTSTGPSNQRKAVSFVVRPVVTGAKPPTSTGPSKRPVVTGAKPPTSTGPSKRPALKSLGRAEANARIGPKPAPSGARKPPKLYMPTAPAVPKVSTDMRETALRFGSQGRSDAVSDYSPRVRRTTNPKPSTRPALKSLGRAEANARIGPKPAPKPPKVMKTSMDFAESGHHTMGVVSNYNSKMPIGGSRRLFPSAETKVKRPKASAKPSVGSVLKKFLNQMQRNRRRPGSSNPR